MARNVWFYAPPSIIPLASEHGSAIPPCDLLATHGATKVLCKTEDMVLHAKTVGDDPVSSDYYWNGLAVFRHTVAKT